MYFWNIKKLTEALVNNSLNKIAFYLYVFVNILFIFSIFYSNDDRLYSNILLHFILLINLSGLYFAYLVNGGISGHGFLKRFVSVNFVLAIRFLVLWLPIFLLIYFILFLFDFINDYWVSVYEFIWAGSVEILYNYFLLKYFSNLKEREGKNMEKEKKNDIILG